MKIVEKDVMKSLLDRIEEARQRIQKDKEDIIYQTRVIDESREIIKRLENEKNLL